MNTALPTTTTTTLPIPTPLSAEIPVIDTILHARSTATSASMAAKCRNGASPGWYCVLLSTQDLAGQLANSTTLSVVLALAPDDPAAAAAFADLVREIRRGVLDDDDDDDVLMLDRGDGVAVHDEDIAVG
ncbi:hypothetical protein SLS54_006856 [Diplodia seriata]